MKHTRTIRRLVLYSMLFGACLTPKSNAIEPEPNWKLLYERYLEEAQGTVHAPQLGDKISIVRRIGGEVSGVLVDITADTITITNRSGKLTYQRNDLTPESVQENFFQEAAKAQAVARIRAEKKDYDQKATAEERTRQDEIARIAEENARAAEATRIAEDNKLAKEREKQEQIDAIKETAIPILVLAAIALFYFLPAVIASRRHHHNSGAIFMLNLLLGWTFLGWVVSLVWALTKVEKKQ